MGRDLAGIFPLNRFQVFQEFQGIHLIRIIANIRELGLSIRDGHQIIKWFFGYHALDFLRIQMECMKQLFPIFIMLEI